MGTYYLVRRDNKTAFDLDKGFFENLVADAARGTQGERALDMKRTDGQQMPLERAREDENRIFALGGLRDTSGRERP